MSGVICERCIRVHDGDRSSARRAGWEPTSMRTQAAIDAGPMICPDCLLAAIDGALGAALDAARARPELLDEPACTCGAAGDPDQQPCVCEHVEHDE